MRSRPSLSSLREYARRKTALAAVVSLTLLGAVVVGGSAVGADTPGPVPGYDYSHAIVPLAGCEANELPGNDDGYVSDPVPLGFDINFYGDAFSNAFVNNNGNITFDAPTSTYVPYPLEDAATHPIIAPFFTDVDTRGPGRTLHYGSGTTDSGQKYFCVDWIEVAQFPANDSQGLDDFQLVLYDASGAPGGHSGDFDIEFNYDHMPWDHGGSARAGFAAGTGNGQPGSGDPGTSLELPGGGTSGAMIDGGPNALVSSSANSATLGRYHFQIRGDGIVNTGSFTGTVTDQDGNTVSGATVQACRTNGYCRTGVSSPDGTYAVNNLAGGDYNLTVSPPNGDGNPAHGTGTLTSNTDTQTVNLQLTTPHPTPPNTTIGDTNGTTTVDGTQVAVLYWGVSHPLTFTACSGAQSAQVQFEGYHLDGTPYSSTVTAVESPTTPGTYTATIPQFDTLQVHGDMVIHELVDCIGNGPTDESFTIYIDPSGTVVDQAGNPVEGATVTLLSADSIDGTYTPVAQGSTVMSPSNRTNPDTTNGDGMYGWDVTAGYYKVEATKDGCDTADSPALTIPPAVTGLVLHLNCAGTSNGSPAVDAGPDEMGAVNTAIALEGSASDPDSDPLTIDWSIDSSSCTFSDSHSPTSTVTCTQQGTFTATLTASDGVNPPVSDTTAVTVDGGTTGATCFGFPVTSGVTRTTSGGVTTITGTSGDDVIVGTSGDDVIRAGAGNDIVCAGPGNDKVYGGTGNDVLRGQAGNDVVQGQGGDDRVYGNDGNDTLRGNDGVDKVYGGRGDDKVYGGRSTDLCNGGPGTDRSRTCETLVGFP